MMHVVRQQWYHHTLQKYYRDRIRHRSNFQTYWSYHQAKKVLDNNSLTYSEREQGVGVKVKLRKRQVSSFGQMYRLSKVSATVLQFDLLELACLSIFSGHIAF